MTRPFVKMNGLGNEIVIVDLRRVPGPIGAAEARGFMGLLSPPVLAMVSPDQ